MEKTAEISVCGQYRYNLTRTWDKTLPVMGVCMLNPSKADADVDDPTITRLIKRARMLGFGGIHVVNLFAYRSTDPTEIRHAANPVGFATNTYIKEMLKITDFVLIGWGTWGSYKNRDKEVMGIFQKAGVIPKALLVLQCGAPGHPLYVSYLIQPKNYSLHGAIDVTT